MMDMFMYIPWKIGFTESFHFYEKDSGFLLIGIYHKKFSSFFAFLIKKVVAPNMDSTVALKIISAILHFCVWKTDYTNVHKGNVYACLVFLKKKKKR